MKTRTKTRSIALLLAVVMAAVCLAGCSNNFNSKKVIEVAKDYGMRELTKEEFEVRMEGYNLTPEVAEVLGNIINAPVYYVAKDSVEADQIYDRFFHLYTNDIADLEEYLQFQDPKSSLTMHLLMCRTKESAKRHYDDWVKYWMEDEDTTGYSGKKSGCEYSIIHYETSWGTRYIGMYLKGNAFIYLDIILAPEDEHACLDHFCKKLGLVSPLEPEKK